MRTGVEKEEAEIRSHSCPIHHINRKNPCDFVVRPLPIATKPIQRQDSFQRRHHTGHARDHKERQCGCSEEIQVISERPTLPFRTGRYAQFMSIV